VLVGHAFDLLSGTFFSRQVNRAVPGIFLGVTFFQQFQLKGMNMGKNGEEA
jgi:hypothetical protein